MNYVVEKFDLVNGEWHYMNSFKTYSEASEALDMMAKRYRGTYRIRETL